MFTFWLASRIQKALALLRPGLQFRIREIFGQLFVPVAERAPFPGWFDTLRDLLPDAEAEDWDWLVRPFPDAAEFVDLFSGQHGVRRQARLGLGGVHRWTGPVVDDLAWNINPSSVVQRVTAAWSSHLPILSRFYYLAALRDKPEESMGSGAQLSHLRSVSDEEVTILRLFVGISPADASLAVCFHPTTVWDDAFYEPAVAYDTQCIPAEATRLWVLQDLNPAPGDMPAPAGNLADILLQ
jgi:hypothetical protein